MYSMVRKLVPNACILVGENDCSLRWKRSGYHGQMEAGRQENERKAPGSYTLLSSQN